MPKLTPTAAAQKWQTNTAGAAAAYVAGAQSTTKDPTALAAAAAQTWVQNLQTAYQNGLFQAGLQRKGKAGWLAGITGKGQANFSNGVNNAVGEVTSVFNQLFPFEANLQAQIDAMPNVTPTDAENRMLAWTRGMRAARGQFRER